MQRVGKVNVVADMPIAKWNVRESFKQPVASEHVEQVNLFRWARLESKKYPGLDMMFAIPNGGMRHPVVAAKLKEEGVKPGIPDIFLPVPRGKYNGMFIELKRTKGSGKRKNQDNAIEYLNELGYYAVKCFGCREAIAEIKKYYRHLDLGCISRKSLVDFDAL